jgi:hypothetical protein
VLDTHMPQQTFFAYSVYSVTGRYGQGPPVYESANELALMHGPTYLRGTRGTALTLDMHEPYAAGGTGSWHHIALAWTADPALSANGQSTRVRPQTAASDLVYQEWHTPCLHTITDLRRSRAQWPHT